MRARGAFPPTKRRINRSSAPAYAAPVEATRACPVLRPCAPCLNERACGRTQPPFPLRPCMAPILKVECPRRRRRNPRRSHRASASHPRRRKEAGSLRDPVPPSTPVSVGFCSLPLVEVKMTALRGTHERNGGARGRSFPPTRRGSARRDGWRRAVGKEHARGLRAYDSTARMSAMKVLSASRTKPKPPSARRSGFGREPTQPPAVVQAEPLVHVWRPKPSGCSLCTGFTPVGTGGNAPNVRDPPLSSSTCARRTGQATFLLELARMWPVSRDGPTAATYSWRSNLPVDVRSTATAFSPPR